MTRTLAGMNVVALLTVAGFGQTAGTPAAFEIADIHKSPRATNPYMRDGAIRAGRYTVRFATMVQLIMAAYGVDAQNVQGGPGWLDMDRFDITAKAPVNTTPGTLKVMLQTLLADRFKLKVHTDTKPLPVWVLMVGKGKPKLKQSDESSGSSGCHGKPPDTTPGAVRYAVVECRSQSMEQVTQDVRNFGGPYFDHPVVDKTGLTGNWDFELRWTPRGGLANAGADGISIFDAVEKQLGLKLELQKLPFPVVVVDSANENPTDNPTDINTKMPPPPPAEFEVATIKPSRPGAVNMMGKLEHGRVDVENFPLKNLILIAWELNTDELLGDVPKFLDTARFDITAKAAPPPPGTEIDFDALRLMLKALLVERFNLKTHFEDRPVNGYVLTAVKPKLQKADPSNRTGCKEGPGADGKDPRIAHPILSRLLTCQNMTMGQFVDSLPNLAGGYAHVQVLDATGLTDAYDFTLSFSAVGAARGEGSTQPPKPEGGASEASDPNGALSLEAAVSRQMGLRLELKKRPMPVLVIDHVDEKPTEN